MLFKTFIKKFFLAKKSSKKNIIFSGGKSIHKALNLVSTSIQTPKKMDVHLLDERIIKNNNLRNYSLIKKKLKKNKFNILTLERRKINKLNINNLKKKFKNSKPITILGMGDDGHFASIFNSSKLFKELIDKKNKPNILVTEKIGKPFCKRLTMNLSMILLSYKIIIFLNERKKINLFKKFMNSQDKFEYPIFHLMLHGKKKILISINGKLSTFKKLNIGKIK